MLRRVSGGRSVSATYRCTFVCEQSNGVLIEPSVHFQTDLSFVGDEPSPDDVAGGAWTLLGTAFKALCRTDVTVHRLVATEQVLKPAIGAVGLHTVEEAGTYSAADAHVPAALVPLINLHTAVASRSARGHLFLGGPRDTITLISGKWSSSWLTRMTTFADLLDNSFDLGTIDVTHVHPVVYSRTRHRNGTEPHTFRVTKATANNQPTWLRSRLTVP